MSTQTKKQYASAYNVVRKITGQDMDYVLRNPKITFDKIKAYEYKEGKQYDKKSIKNLITAILSLFKNENGVVPAELQETHQQYLFYFRELKQEIIDFYDKNEPTEKQKNGVLKWADVIKRRDEIGEKEMGSRRHLLLSMYTYIPPLRQDFNLIKILQRKPRRAEGNYIVLNASTSILVLNNYKTAVKYGKLETKLPTELVKVIKRSLELQPRDFLFVDLEGKPYNGDNSFTVFSNRALKDIFNNQSVSVSMLRHSFISSLDFNNLTDGEKKVIAKEMGHSVEQQSQYRHLNKKVDE
jgi:hypothetical protein